MKHDDTTPAHTTQDADLPPLTTMAEAAAFLRISQKHLNTLVQRGDIPARLVGKRRRFLRDELLAYVTRTQVEPKGVAS